LIEVAVIKGNTDWSELRVNINRQTADHQLVLEVTTHNSNCLVAVDNIQISQGTCSYTTTQQIQPGADSGPSGVDVDDALAARAATRKRRSMDGAPVVTGKDVVIV
jgi:hypothetical protein